MKYKKVLEEHSVLSSLLSSILLFLTICTMVGLICQYHKEIIDLLNGLCVLAGNMWNGMSLFWRGFIITGLSLLTFLYVTVGLFLWRTRFENSSFYGNLFLFMVPIFIIVIDTIFLLGIKGLDLLLPSP